MDSSAGVSHDCFVRYGLLDGDFRYNGLLLTLAKSLSYVFLIDKVVNIAFYELDYSIVLTLQ